MSDVTAAAPQGRAQTALMQKLQTVISGMLTDIAHDPDLRGVHFAAILSAAEALAKKGLVTFDGVNISLKKASLRSHVIRLAHERPELRPYLLPLVTGGSSPRS